MWGDELGTAAAADRQRVDPRHAVRRRRDVLHADLQGLAGGQLRAGRVPADRRLGLLVAARGSATAVLGRLPDDARLHDGVRHPAAGGGAAADDRRADHLGDHGDGRPVDLLPGRHEVDLRGNRAAVPADLRSRRGQRLRPQRATDLPDEPGRLARDHGRLRDVLQILALWGWRCGRPRSISRWRRASVSRCR